jgi:hypothetical protein
MFGRERWPSDHHVDGRARRAHSSEATTKETSMRPRLVTMLILAPFALGACGGSSHGPAHNDAIISDAKAADASAHEVHAKLARKLQLHEYAGVSDAFTIPPGKRDVRDGESGRECSIDGIFVADSVQAYRGDDATLISPGGDAAVKVTEFRGTPESDCLEIVRKALGW